MAGAEEAESLGWARDAGEGVSDSEVSEDSVHLVIEVHGTRLRVDVFVPVEEEAADALLSEEGCCGDSGGAAADDDDLVVGSWRRCHDATLTRVVMAY